MNSFKKIGIVGMGLMGGSILKKLQIEKVPVVSEFLEDCDVAILAVPLSRILPCAEEIAAVNPAAVIIDIGSVKAPIAQAFEAMTSDKVEFVATHPMAGSEKNGFEHSRPDLFEGATWVITPHAKNKSETLEKIKALIRLLGANPIVMEPETHDRRAAIVSHVPYLISSALLRMANKTDPHSLDMAGPGFKSMTRLAYDNPEMHREIESFNKENIQRYLKEFIDVLEESL